MRGDTHSLSGILVGAVTAPVMPLDGPSRLAWVAAWGGFALLPDLDQSGSSAARMWGPPTRLLGSHIGRLARGHRQGTHDALIAPPVAAGVAALAFVHPYAATVVLAVTIGLALVALDPFIPGRGVHPLVSIPISWGVGYWLAGAVAWWLPLAAAGGVLMHLAGDWPTTGQLPVPLTSWGKERPRFGPQLFSVEKKSRTRKPGPETLVRWAMWVVLLYVTFRTIQGRP